MAASIRWKDAVFLEWNALCRLGCAEIAVRLLLSSCHWFALTAAVWRVDASCVAFRLFVHAVPPSEDPSLFGTDKEKELYIIKEAFYRVSFHFHEEFYAYICVFAFMCLHVCMVCVCAFCVCVCVCLLVSCTFICLCVLFFCVLCVCVFVFVCIFVCMYMFACVCFSVFVCGHFGASLNGLSTIRTWRSSFLETKSHASFSLGQILSWIFQLLVISLILLF